MKFGIQLSTKSQSNNSTATTRCHDHMQFVPLHRTLNKKGLWQNRKVISLPDQMPNKVGCVILAWLGSWVKGCQIASVQNNLAMGICPFKPPHEGTRRLNPSRPERSLTCCFPCGHDSLPPGQWHFSSFFGLSNHQPAKGISSWFLPCGISVDVGQLKQKSSFLTERKSHYSCALGH